MFDCFGRVNRRERELQQQVGKLEDDNKNLKLEKAIELEQVQKENQKLNQKLSEIKKSLATQTTLTEDLNKKLIGCDKQLEEYKLENSHNKVEIQSLKKQSQEKDGSNCKLKNQIKQFEVSENNFKQREVEYNEIINKLRADLNNSIKQNKIYLEENLKLTKKLTEQEIVYHTVEQENNLRRYSEQDLSTKNLKIVEFGKSKSHTDLQIMKQIHTKPELKSYQGEASKEFQIQILKEQVMEQEQQNQTLKLEKLNYEAQINDLRKELVHYKQTVAKLENLNKIHFTKQPAIKINETKSVIELPSNQQTNTQVTEAICDADNHYEMQDILQELANLEHHEKLSLGGDIEETSVGQQAEETFKENKQLELYTRNSLDKINEIYQDTVKLEKEIEEFSGTKEDKDFLHLNELLMRNIVKLDNVDSEGLLIIREKRKDAIQFVQKLYSALNNKVK